MNFLDEIKNKRRRSIEPKQIKACDDMYLAATNNQQSRRNHLLNDYKMILDNFAEIFILLRTQAEDNPLVIIRQMPKEIYDALMQITDNSMLLKIRKGCRLLNKKYSLIDLLPPQSIVVRNNITYARVFHGTNSKCLIELVKNGLKVIGGGVLENGLYVSPSLKVAAKYTTKQQMMLKRQSSKRGSNTENKSSACSNRQYPIVLEIWIENPSEMNICCIDHTNMTSCCNKKDAIILTDHSGGELREFWQFAIINQQFLSTRCFFNIWLLS